MKKIYLTPQTDVLDLSYADPVCTATSGVNVPDYDYNPLSIDMDMDSMLDINMDMGFKMF